MNIPFGLKQKPLRHYFDNGVVKFACVEGRLRFQVTKITRDTYAPLAGGWVQSKEHLDRLLHIKSLNEIPTIEEVVS